MFGRHRKSHRRVHAGGLAALLLAACAGTPDEPPPEPPELRCSPHTTLVCAYRMGEPYKCSCKSKDALREIFEPEVY